ncbi:dTDP-glucose 4,6-dehydratase [Patescibacteria group bacterium]|nr:dTDP-glucose 4,6-dehydratase [Patescibacteria group bacterium]
MQNNYEAAGQVVPHVHFHLIPRKSGDNSIYLKNDFYKENEAFTIGNGIKKSIHKNILVCGGAGFIGSNFIRYRLNNDPDCKIVNFDKLTYAGNLDNLHDVVQDSRYVFVQGDITDLESLNKAIKEHDITHIINFAAETHVDRSIHGGSRDFVLTNSLGVQMILDAVRMNNIKKYVQVSTDEVFGALELNSKEKFKENTPIMPNMPYAAAKAGGDLMCNAYFVTHKVPVVVTHCSNNYGPYQFPEKVIPSFIFRLSSNEKVPIYGDGKNVRDWIHVNDHASALSLLLDRGEPGQVYNIGSDNERDNLELTRMLLNHFNLSDDMIEFVEDRKGHDRRYAIDSSKIEALGWRPVYTREKFAEGMKQTIEWYLSNPEWVQKLRDRKAEWDEKALRSDKK